MCAKRERDTDNMMAFALRFTEFCAEMDSVADARKLLAAAIETTTHAANERGCCLTTLREKDARYTVPAAIVQAIAAKGAGAVWNGKKVQGTWIVLYLAGVLPPQTKSGWELFECSHLCLDKRCLASAHLVWESKATNQSRGHMHEACRKACSHGCGQMLCVCQRLHFPPCVE